MKYPVRLSKKLSYRKENQYQTDKMVVVLINATAGVGKQTIAKALQ
jgi:adenylylsulfate kinase-like enzyme